MVLTSLKSPMKLSVSGRSLGTKKTWFFFCLRAMERVCEFNCKCICMRASRWPYHSLYSSGKQISPLYKVAVCKLIGHRAMWRRSFEPSYCVIKSWLDICRAFGCELECTSDMDSWADHSNCIVNMLPIYSPWLFLKSFFSYYKFSVWLCYMCTCHNPNAVFCFHSVMLNWCLCSCSTLKHPSHLMGDKLGVVIKSITSHHLHLHWSH